LKAGELKDFYLYLDSKEIKYEKENFWQELLT
jgi:hypothetical protein